MDKQVLDYVVAKSKELMTALHCSKEAKAAAQAWLDAVGTANESAETKKYIAELEADIVAIDDLIGLAESATGLEIFGADLAKQIAAHAKDIKAQGATHCDCPACTVVAEILAKKAEILA